MSLFLKMLDNTSLRRCAAFLFHAAGIGAAYWAAHLLRFDFSVPEEHWASFGATFWWVLASYLACIVVFRLYRGLWRFFTLRDCLISVVAFSLGTALAGGVIFAVNGFTFEGIPRSVLIITLMLVLTWEIGARGGVRWYRESSRRDRNGDGSVLRRVLLIGNPEEADSVLRGLQQRSSELGKVVGIVSNKRSHAGSSLRGVGIHSGLDRVADLVESLAVKTLLFLPPFTSPVKIRQVIDSLTERKLKCDYRVIPSIDEIASGRVDVSSIRKVAIEDLLQRVPYRLPVEMLAERIRGRRVLVTGAGGSIGSEICRQLLRFAPESVVLFDVSEFLVFLVERELREEAESLGIRLEAVTGDTRRSDDLKRAIAFGGGADLVYHAAAYKHVDLMERNVVSCFQNNVLGTLVAAEVAEAEGVKEFVLVSTDKAVRPTSLMGASKRLAERIVMERPAAGTVYKAVRFGNVLGSNGSVIPIFREQIEKGGPVTVTSREVTRFFMTIPEAVELVLAAGAIGEDRKIFVLEMGEAVKIDAMARRMIELSGFVPEEEIPIVYTGLKPGEKEYEELLTDDEDVVRTDLDRIWVVEKNRDLELAPLEIGRLLELIDDADEDGLRRYAHSLIRGSRLLDGTGGGA